MSWCREAFFGCIASRKPSTGARWTRTHTSRLLLETSYLWSQRDTNNNYRDANEPWSAQFLEEPGVPSRTGMTSAPSALAILEVTTGQLIGGAPSVSDANASNSWELRSTATYVTGSHSIKGGFSLLRGSYHRPANVVGDVVLNYSGGNPLQLVATVPTNRRDDIDGDWAFFVQDRWTVNRLTVSAGLRLDWLMTSYPDQLLPGNLWTAARRAQPSAPLFSYGTSPVHGFARNLPAGWTASPQA